MSFMKHPAHPETMQTTIYRKGGGGGTTTTESKQNNEPWVGQQPFLKDVYGQAQNQFNSSTPSYFPGETLAGFNPNQQVAQQAGANRAFAGSDLQRAGQGEAQKTIQGDYLQQGNPYMGGVMDSIEAQVMPRVQGQFSSAGRLRSGLGQAEATGAMTRAMAPYAFGEYGAERNRMTTQSQAAPGMAQADYNDVNALNTIGGQQQQQSQAEINAAVEEHNFNQGLPAAKLAQYSNLLGAPVGGMQTGTSTQTQSGGKGGGIGSLLGGAGQAASGGAAIGGLFSDRRLKRNIQHIGELASGLKTYLFRYLWSDDWYTGVMAQEAEKLFPEAVSEVGGFKMVDYARIA